MPDIRSTPALPPPAPAERLEPIVCRVDIVQSRPAPDRCRAVRGIDAAIRAAIVALLVLILASVALAGLLTWMTQ